MAIRDLLRPPPQIWVRQGAEVIDTTPFWEERARRFAGEGEGLRAVCSFAMPGFYNWAIESFSTRQKLRMIRRRYRIPDEKRDSGAIWYVLLFKLNFWVRQIYADRFTLWLSLSAVSGIDPASI